MMLEQGSNSFAKSLDLYHNKNYPYHQQWSCIRKASDIKASELNVTIQKHPLFARFGLLEQHHRVKAELNR